MEKWGFDGLDLDYEHPHAAEKVGYANWVKGLRQAFGDKYEVQLIMDIKWDQNYPAFHLLILVDSSNICTSLIHPRWFGHSSNGREYGCHPHHVL